MNKFGLLDEEESGTPGARNITDDIAMFSPVKRRPTLDIAAVDAAAARHGFVDRQTTNLQEAAPNGRRRRAVPSEPTRHLAIRLTARGYSRFVAYADRHKLTYHDALMQLMDTAGE